MIDVRQVSTPEELEKCRQLRRVVFIEEQQVPEDLEWDGQDGAATHFLLLLDSEPSATLRLRFIDNVAKVERVCVDRKHRGKDLGLLLMQRALEHVRGIPNIAQVKLGAQVFVIGFYERLGFEAHGPEFDDAGIPHRMMTLDLARSE